jgi:adenylate cyclase
MEFRIGINLGDVIEEGDTIYGDGVNIAARLEGLAEAGGICISGSAYEQIENKLPLRYDYMGEHEVKNIAKPVRVYCARIEADAAPSKLGKEKKPVGKRLSKAALAIIAVVVIAGLAALYQFALRPSPPKMEVASKEKMAFPLPDVPSIAVLPFVNMSEDPKQEFLCDAMTEDIIAALSRVPRLVVIARNSTFTYKGKPVKVKQVSEELGVRYVLEGSLQRSGDRVRVTAQLIDALTGAHLWAERYDRNVEEIFALQDEITIKILSGVHVKLTGERLVGTNEKYFKGKQGLDCYLKFAQAYGHYTRWNIHDNNMARRLIEEAIAMCPENPWGYTHLGWVYQHDLALGNTKSPRETLEKAKELAQKALAMDDSIANAHSLLCAIYLFKRENDKAMAEGERAVALDPGGPSPLVTYALSLMAAGRREEAIPVLQKAIRLNPFAPSYIYREFGTALWMTGRAEEALSAYKKAIQIAPDESLSHIALVVIYSDMGREKEARAEAAEVLRLNPKFSVDSHAKFIGAIMDQSQINKIVNALRKAGLK